MADKKPSPVMVGRQFIKKYYERLDKNPETVFRFYQVCPSAALLSALVDREP